MKKILFFIVLMFCSASLNAKDKNVKISNVYIKNDKSIYYDSNLGKNKLFLKSSIFNFFIANKSKNNKWILVYMHLHDGTWISVFNLPNNKRISVEDYGTLADFGTDDNGDFIWVDCRLNSNCEGIIFEGEKAYTKIYFNNLNKEIKKFENAQDYINSLEKKLKKYNWD